jgi:putative phosphoesterase
MHCARAGPGPRGHERRPVTRVVVLADTHIRRGSRRRLSDAVVAELEHADVILHAGDLLVPELLDELSGFAPVHAVLGNNDQELVGCLPEHLVVDIDGVRIAMVHDSGARAGRAGRMRRRFPDAALVVFGHSHIPADELGIDGQLLFNPGSPTERRGQPHHTLGRLELIDGRVAAHEIHVV